MKAIRSISAAWTIAICALLLASCGGGSGTTPLPLRVPQPAPTASAGGGATTQSVKAVVTIDGSADTATRLIAAHEARKNGGRAPMYVSASTNGLQLSVNGTTSTYDVSSGSSLCTSGSPRTCTLTFAAPVGSDTFTLDEYDQAPSGGSIPGTAKHLATTTLVQTIVANTANTINFVVSGIIAGVATSGGVTYASLPSGSSHTYGIALIVTDADGNTITGSAAYSNPISVSLSETGGSGYACVQVNGGYCQSTATVTYPSDSLSLYYNGGGAAGYSTTTTISASGSSSATLRVSPLYISGSFAATDAGQVVTRSVTEASAPANVAYSTSWSCSNFSGASISGSGASANVSITSPSAVTGSTLLSSYSCGNITISDNYGSSISTSVSASIPTTTFCASSPANTYLGAKSGSQYVVSTGAPCALSVGTTSGTIYTSGSTPTSFTSAISEANDVNGMTLSGCSGVASLSSSSITGSGSYSGTTSATITISSSAVGTCSITVNDNNGQTKTISVTVNQGTVTLETTSPAQTLSAGDPCYPDPIDGQDCPPTQISFDIGYNGSNGVTQTFTTSASYLAVNATETDEANGGGYDCIVLHEWSGTTNYYYELAPNGTGAPGSSITYNQTFANPHAGWSAEVWVENDSPGMNNSHIGDVYAIVNGSGTVTTAGSANATLGAATTSWSGCY